MPRKGKSRVTIRPATSTPVTNSILLPLVINNDVAALRQQLAFLSPTKKKALNTNFCDGLNLLHIAINQSSEATALLLLKHGMDPNKLSDDGLYPLQLAALSNKLLVVKQLIEVHQISPHQVNTKLKYDNGYNPSYICAAESGSIEVLQYLNTIVDLNHIIITPRGIAINCLSMSIQYARNNTFTYLLNRQDEHGNFCIQLQPGSADEPYKLNLCPLINTIDSNVSPLQKQVVINLLLRRGFDLLRPMRMANYHKTSNAAIQLLEKGDNWGIDILIAAHKDVNNPFSLSKPFPIFEKNDAGETSSNITIIHYLVSHSHHHDRLLKVLAAITDSTLVTTTIDDIYYPTTPLFIACIFKNLPVLQILMQYRQQFDLPPLDPRTDGLNFAAAKGYIDIVRYFMAQNIDVNFTRGTEPLCHPLHSAVEDSQTAVAKLLLEHGADPNIMQERLNKSGTIHAIAIAIKNGDLATLQLLIAHSTAPLEPVFNRHGFTLSLLLIVAQRSNLACLDYLLTLAQPSDIATAQKEKVSTQALIHNPNPDVALRLIEEVDPLELESSVLISLFNEESQVFQAIFQRIDALNDVLLRKIITIALINNFPERLTYINDDLLLPQLQSHVTIDDISIYGTFFSAINADINIRCANFEIWFMHRFPGICATKPFDNESNIAATFIGMTPFHVACIAHDPDMLRRLNSYTLNPNALAHEESMIGVYPALMIALFNPNIDILTTLLENTALIIPEHIKILDETINFAQLLMIAALYNSELINTMIAYLKHKKDTPILMQLRDEIKQKNSYSSIALKKVIQQIASALNSSYKPSPSAKRSHHAAGLFQSSPTSSSSSSSSDPMPSSSSSTIELLLSQWGVDISELSALNIEPSACLSAFITMLGDRQTSLSSTDIAQVMAQARKMAQIAASTSQPTASIGQASIVQTDCFIDVKPIDKKQLYIKHFIDDYLKKIHGAYETCKQEPSFIARSELSYYMLRLLEMHLVQLKSQKTWPKKAIIKTNATRALLRHYYHKLNPNDLLMFANLLLQNFEAQNLASVDTMIHMTEDIYINMISIIRRPAGWDASLLKAYVLQELTHIYELKNLLSDQWIFFQQDVISAIKFRIVLCGALFSKIPDDAFSAEQLSLLHPIRLCANRIAHEVEEETVCEIAITQEVLREEISLPELRQLLSSIPSSPHAGTSYRSPSYHS